MQTSIDANDTKQYFYVAKDGTYCKDAVTKQTFNKGILEGKLHFQPSRTKGENDLDLFMKNTLVGYFFEKREDQITHLREIKVIK